jgi:beta-glucanase (GH16 family)
LPAGLTLSSSGVISGTPTAAVASSFSVTVKDSESAPQSVTGALKLTIAAAATTPAALKLTTATLAKGTVGTAYSAALAATGGTSPYKWSVASGSLPAGLTLSSTGTISGTPKTAAASSFSVSVKDSETTPQSATASLTLTVIAGSSSVTPPTPVSVTTTSLPAGTAGSAYSKTLAATGGTSPYTWSVASGSLPAGLTLSSAGVISGKPTAAGNSSFTLEVKDSEASPLTATAIESIAVSAAVTTGATAPAAAQNAGYTNLAFNGTFDTLSLSNTGTGAGYTWYNSGIWYQTPASGASTPNNNGGVLNLPWNPGQSAPTTTVATMASNGENYTSWTHGYIEVSMAFPPVSGIWPALWMENNTATTSYVPTASSTHTYGELDIFEWQSQIPTTFNGHIHDWTGSGSMTDAQNNDNNSTAIVPSGTNFADYNTYGILWTPTEIDWYFNNKLLFTATSSQYPEAFATFNSSPMYLMLGNQPGSNWGSGAGPSAATNMTVAWVHVWQ